MSEEKVWAEFKRLTARFRELNGNYELWKTEQERKYAVLRAETDALQDVVTMQMDLINRVAELADAGDASGIKKEIADAVSLFVARQAN